MIRILEEKEEKVQEEKTSLQMKTRFYSDDSYSGGRRGPGEENESANEDLNLIR